MKKKILKPFDIEKAKAGAEVCTRDGHKARVICFDMKGGTNRPIIALYNMKEDLETIDSYSTNGYSIIGEKSPNDLMLVEYEEEQTLFELFDKVLVRDNDNEEWKVGIFSQSNDSLYRFVCVSVYKQCIPFSGNEHLLGTTDKSE